MFIYLSLERVREAAEKVIFLMVRPLRPNPLPLDLSGHIFFEFFFEIQKKLFF